MNLDCVLDEELKGCGKGHWIFRGKKLRISFNGPNIFVHVFSDDRWHEIASCSYRRPFPPKARGGGGRHLPLFYNTPAEEDINRKALQWAIHHKALRRAVWLFSDERWTDLPEDAEPNWKKMLNGGNATHSTGHPYR
jgi:hypothetical protein